MTNPKSAKERAQEIGQRIANQVIEWGQLPAWQWRKIVDVSAEQIEAAEAPLLARIEKLEKERHEAVSEAMDLRFRLNDAGVKIIPPLYACVVELEEMLRVATNALEYYAAMKYDAGKREWMSSGPGKAVSVLARLKPHAKETM